MSSDLPSSSSLMTCTQDMFYSYFLTRCSEFRIRKPNKWILDMLENFDDDNTSGSGKEEAAAADATTTNQYENAAKQIAADAARPEDRSVLEQVFEQQSGKQDVTGSPVPAHTIEVEPVPLHEKKQTRLVESKTQSRKNVKLYPQVETVPLCEKTHFVVPPTVILGNTTLSILIEMFYFMPKLESIDFSNCRLFDVDPQRIAPTGNEILRSLFDLICVHPSISQLNLGKRGGPNQIGTEVGSWMIRAARENPRLVEIEFDERGIERHVLDDIIRSLKINKNAQSPLSTVIRSIRVISPELVNRMHSMKEIGAIDRKTSDERQQLLSVLYDRSKLFFSLLDEESRGTDQTTFVGPAKQWLLSEGVLNPQLQGVRGDGKHLYIITSGTLTFKLGRFEVTLSRGDIFGEKLSKEDFLFASGLIVRRSANGTFFTVPHRVCEPLFSSWEKRIVRWMPLLKKNPILNALPSYLLARCCYDAELITIQVENHNTHMGNSMIREGEENNENSPVDQKQQGSEEMANENNNSRPSSSASSSRNKKRIIKAGDSFSGFYIVVQGTFTARQHKHVAKFLENKEKARAMREGAILDFDEASLFGEEALVNRRRTSTVDIDCTTTSTNNNNEEGNSVSTTTCDEWQVLRLDQTFCSSVLFPLLETVLVLQARSYGSEWNSEEEQLSHQRDGGNNKNKNRSDQEEREE